MTQPNTKLLRQQVKAALKQPGAPEVTERRAYMLPVRVVERILQYQLEHRCRSEAHAVRELLSHALDAFEKTKKGMAG